MRRLEAACDIIGKMNEITSVVMQGFETESNRQINGNSSDVVCVLSNKRITHFKFCRKTTSNY